MSLQGFEFGAASVFINAPAATQAVDLESDKGNFWVAPSVEDEDLDLQAGLTQSVLYSKDYQIFEKNIFKQSFGMNANYVNQGQTSNIKVNIFLNG